MKENFQKELLEKVKPGTKPSDIKRLKRSKSDSDISSVPAAPPLPTSIPLSKSSSQPAFSDKKYPYTILIAQTQEIEQLKKESESKSTTISLLRKKIEELEQHQSLPNSELDTALFARHQNLKSWFTQYQQTRKLDKELVEKIDEVSTELLSRDEKISQLRTELRKLEQTNQSLRKDLELAQRLAQARKVPYYPNQPDYPFLRYGLYSLAVAVFTLWLTNSLKKYYE